MLFPDAVLKRFKTPAYLLCAEDIAPTRVLCHHDAQETVFFEYHVWEGDFFKIRFRVYGSPIYWAILDYCCECFEQSRQCPVVDHVLEALQLTTLHRPHVLLCLHVLRELLLQKD